MYTTKFSLIAIISAVAIVLSASAPVVLAAPVPDPYVCADSGGGYFGGCDGNGNGGN
ncbi:hypothetical protein BGX26_004676, partial [Mortierella sp. AD094]